jgi:ABC-2 type transport system permease protein
VLKEIVRFEWRHHSRQPAFLASAALFFLLGFALVASGFGADNVAVNSPYLVMESFGFLSLLALFAVAIFASNAVLRDDESRMREIVDTTPVARFPFLFGRFAGAFLATLTVVAFSALGGIVATVMPWIDPKRVAAFDLRPYLAAFGVITIPNVLFATALLFTIAMLTRNAIATYAAAMLSYILYLVCSALTDSPLMAQSKAGGGGGTLPALLDPFGLTAFFDVTREWTAAAKNARFVPLVGTLLANRAICVVGALLLWAVVYRKRSAGFQPAGPRPSRPPRRQDARGPAGWKPALLTSSPYLSAAFMELRALFSKTAVLLFVAWIVLAVTQIYSDVLDGEYRSTLYPATSLIVAALEQPLWMIGTILILYFGAEMFWREQRFRMASIVDSAPISGGVMIGAKLTALAALIASLIVGGIVTGVAVQISRGWFDFEPLVYLSLFYLVGLPLLLYAAVSLLIHALSPGKYAGMVFFLLFVIFTRRAPMLGLTHPLWRFGSGPPVPYSEMNGFGHFLGAFSVFMLHWSAYALLFVILATALWRRIGAPVRERMRILARPTPAVLALLAVILATGAWIFAKTDTEDTLAWKADYEKTYKRFAALPKPRVTGVDANVDFDPAARTVRVAARYALVNDSARPIDTIFVAARRDTRLASLAISGARLAATDARFGMRRFELRPPLAPGARAELRFDLTTTEDNDSVVGNGSLLMSFLTLPSLGYRETYELRDPRERQKRGLPVAKETDAGDLGLDDEAAEWIDFRATVSTARDQIAVAPGRLEASGTRGARRWFRYRADAPILNRFGFASARYAVAKRQHGAVSIEVLHVPAHATNVPRMLDSAVAALDVMQAGFGKYPYRELRIVEVPSYAPFAGFALPQIVLLREDRAFLTDARDPDRPDLVARRVAHEVAHQWFGYRFIAPGAPGGLVVTESLTKYGELLTIEKLHGREHVRRFLEIELDRYLSGRTREENREVPLVRVENQPYL